jgi:hypothetical protein
VNTIQATNLTDELRQLLGPDRVLEAQSDLAVYECDAFVIEKHCPNVAVFPQTTAEVAAVVKLCNERATPFVPRGAGTSLAAAVAGGRRCDDRAHADGGLEANLRDRTRSLSRSRQRAPQ